MADEEINLLDLYHAIRRRIRLICMIVVVATLASVLYSLFLPKIYRSEAVILPLGNSSVAGSLGGVIAAQFQSLSALSGGNMGGSGVNAKLTALLQSWTLTKNVIQNHDLLKVFFKDEWNSAQQQWKIGYPPSMEVAVALFQGRLSVADDKKSGMLKIAIEDQSPELAKKIVDVTLIELQSFVSNKELSQAKRRRVFIEKRLTFSKRELLEMGKNLAQVYQGDNISPQAALVDVSIGAEITDDATNDNILAQLTDNLANLSQKKEKLDEAMKHSSVVHNVPQQVYMDYMNQKRQVLVSIVSLLSQEYEMAKMEEAREGVSFQVIDAARVPKIRFKPERRKIVSKAFTFSFLIAVLYVLIKDYFDKIQRAK